MIGNTRGATRPPKNVAVEILECVWGRKNQRRRKTIAIIEQNP
jgi:hypothetical protein